jgi:kumamolisin
MATKKSASGFTSQQRVVLPGSEKASLPATTGEKPVRPSSVFTVSVVVRRKSPLNTRRLGKDRLTRAQYRQQHAADPAAIKLVRAFAKEFGLTVDKDTPKPERRTIKLTGNVAAMEKAFGVKLTQKVLDGATYRVREGSILIPSPLAGAVGRV